MSSLPSCFCSLPMKHVQTRKPGPNTGRWFFGCVTEGCKKFEWDDTTPREQTVSPHQAEMAQNGQRAAPSGHNSAEPSVNGESNRPTYGNSNGGNRGGYGSAPPGPARAWGPGPGNNGGRPSGSPKAAFNPSLPPCEIVFTIFDSDRVAIRYGMNDGVKQWLKQRVPNIIWDNDSKQWLIEQSKYEELADAMEDNLADLVKIKVVRIPDFVLAVQKEVRGRMVIDPEARERTMQNIANRLPEQLFATLLPFQKTGIRKAVENQGCVFLCDEMGLGKTIQALSVLYYYKRSWPALIVCPSSLRFTWRGEIMRWLKLRQDDIQVITTGKDRVDEDKTFVIVSYDLAAKPDVSNDLLNQKFGCVVADESHNLKSKDSKRTLAVTPILQEAEHAILLTGTPALSRPIELFTQLACLRQDLFTSYEEFGQRYCAPKPSRFQRNKTDYTGSANLSELHWMLEKTVLVRRLKKDVLKELPKKIRQQIYVEVPAADRKTLTKMMEELLKLEEQKRALAAKGGSDGKLKQLEVQCRTMYNDLYKQTGTAKLAATSEYLQELFSNPESPKIIVFGHHKEVVDGLCAYTSGVLKTDYIRIDGSTPQKNRQALCDQFQNNPSCRIAILSIKAAGVGLTLNKADHVVFAELYWNPGDLLQGEDRAHRIGRIGPVSVKYIIASNSLDDRQWPLIKRKLDIVGRSVDGNGKDVNIEETDGELQGQARQSNNRAARDQTTITNFFRPAQSFGDAEEVIDDDLEQIMNEFAAADAAAAAAEGLDEEILDDEPVAGPPANGNTRKHLRASSSEEEEYPSPSYNPTKRIGAVNAWPSDFGRNFGQVGSAPPDLPIRRSTALSKPPRDPTLSSDDEEPSGGGFAQLPARSYGSGGLVGARAPEGRPQSGSAPPASVQPPTEKAPTPIPVVSTTTATEEAGGGDQDSFFDHDDDDAGFMAEAIAVATQVELGL